MPKKIGFHVVHATSEDENHRVVQLNVHHPGTRGWQSARFCLYPQVLIIQLDRLAKIRKIQILSHQFLIATKIEFYVGEVPDGLSDQWKNALFKRLGYVEMTSNDKTNYVARELKSVHVDVKGSYIKFIIHKNHLNRLNIFHQVGIIALNIIGDYELDPRINRDDMDTGRRSTLPDVMNRPDYISPMDDLAFDLYQDPEIAKIIRRLEKRKREAALQERFEDAKKIKACIQELQQAGQKLSKLEVEKRRAIEDEDYDVAALKKTEMDECRQLVYRDILADDVLRPSKTSPQQPLHIIDDSDSLRQLTPPLPLPPPPQRHHPQRHAELPVIAATPLPSTSPRNKSSTPISREPYDERILPAIAKKRNLEPPPPSPPSESRMTSRTPFSDRPTDLAEDDATNENFQNEEGENVEEDEILSSKDQGSAAELINVFGQQLATKAFSKSWSRREEAIMSVYNQMQQLDASSDAASRMMRASVVLINRAIKDKVISVFNTGLHLLRMILTKYISKHRIQRSEVHSFLEDIMPNLLTKTGETAQRQRDITKDFILEASQFKDVKPVQTVVTKCLVPVTPSMSARLSLSRTEIVESLYKVHSLTSGLTVENIMKFATTSLAHTSGDVRQKAESLIITLYEDVGPPVRRYLPADGAKTRKNVVYKQLFAAFDEIDEKSDRPMNKMNEKEKKTTSPDDDRQKKLKTLDNAQNSNRRPKDERRTSRLPVKRTNQSSSSVPHPSVSTAGDKDIAPDTAFDDKTCIFCGETNDQFTQAGLDFHYWQNCPMLTRCTHCRTTIELLELTKHLLSGDCKNSDNNNYIRCPRCTEAISKPQYQSHVSQRMCAPAEHGKNRCPLCHTDVPIGDEAWRQHLSGKNGCKENPRRNDHSVKQSKSTNRTAK